MPRKHKSDLETFKEALSMWDRPESELFGTPLDADADVDSFVDRAFTSPSAGVIKV
jgi:hypothetical protein